MSDLTKARAISKILKVHFTNLTVDKTLELTEQILKELEEGRVHFKFMTKLGIPFEVDGTEEAIRNLQKLILELDVRV